MGPKPTIPLQPIIVLLEHPIFAEICSWTFAQGYVGRLLNSDIPQRVKYSNARIWAYRDPSNEIVAFGTLDVCSDYSRWTGNKPHAYLPLLAVRPDRLGMGHGTSIINHLVSEAALLANLPNSPLHDLLFLDVYTDNLPAIGLYEKHGFVKISDQPFPDPSEHLDYFIMAKRLSLQPPLFPQAR